MQPVPIRIRRLSPRAILPEYKSAQAAGMDLAACLPEGETIVIRPGEIVIVPLGFAMALPRGYEGQVRPRSGIATRYGISVPNAPGTIDSDYRGEMRVALINLGREPYTVEHGTRIAQMVIARHEHAVVEEVDELDATARGHGGFGSTGGH